MLVNKDSNWAAMKQRFVNFSQIFLSVPKGAGTQNDNKSRLSYSNLYKKGQKVFQLLNFSQSFELDLVVFFVHANNKTLLNSQSFVCSCCFHNSRERWFPAVVDKSQIGNTEYAFCDWETYRNHPAINGLKHARFRSIPRRLEAWKSFLSMKSHQSWLMVQPLSD